MASWSRSQCGASDRDAIFLNDALGSTPGVQDASQSRVDWMWYQAYGYTYVNRASVGTAYLFGGKHGYYADGDSGMLLLGRRYYLPSFHRFLTQDPSGHSAGLNLYEYASNNPLTNVDPTGTADVRVEYKQLGGLFGINYYHAYIVVTDSRGHADYFRGGPSAGPGSSGVSSSSEGSSSQGSGHSPGGSSGSSSNSSNSTSPGSGGPGQSAGPFGALVSTYGSYTPGTVDWQSGNVPSALVIHDNRSAWYYISRFRAAAAEVDRAGIPYNPLTTNSNAYVNYLLGRAGLRAPQNPVWVPGFDVSLPTGVNRR